MYGFRLLTVIIYLPWIIPIAVLHGAQIWTKPCKIHASTIATGEHTSVGVIYSMDAAYLKEILDPAKGDLSIWYTRQPRIAQITNEQLTCEKPNVYICEEPPQTVAADEGKYCNYRNVRYHEQVYRWVAGRGCLLYTPDFLYVEGHNTINLTAGCFYGPWFAPCLEIAKEDGTCGCYPFDPGFEEVANTVRDAIISSAHGRWEKCFYTASDCCSHVMTGNRSTDQNQCEATFDGWTCWEPAKSDTVANAVCSEFAYSNVGPACHHFSYKQCFSNGTWELQTDYSTCSITPRLLRRYRLHITVLALSIASCLPAIFVFFFYKRLRATRVALHRNLLISIIIRNILVIISRSEVYIDEITNSGDTVMYGHGVACRLLAVAERIAANCVFVCMLVEGVYLHRLIVVVFRKKLNVRWLYGAGIVIALVPALAWAIVMDLMNDHSCWIVYTVEHVQWILDAPRIAILLINTVLFVDILRVLLTKLRNTENSYQLSTAKATLFLMPLFGTQFLLTAFRPTTSSCTWEQVYYYVSYTLEGLQGFIVALLYCYVNKEVHTLVKATYKKTENAVNSRVRGSSNPPMSFDPNSNRRITYSTNLQSHNIDDSKDQYTSMTPKLHVAEIISIQASERLAEILDPIYETIDNGLTNEGYDYLSRSDPDNDSEIIPNRDSNADDDYGFSKGSNVSEGCPVWIRLSSPSTINSLNKQNTENLSKSNNTKDDITKNQNDETISVATLKNESNQIHTRAKENDSSKDGGSGIGSEYEDCENMISEIMHYIENIDNSDVVLDPEILCPNRNDENKIIFVDK